MSRRSRRRPDNRRHGRDGASWFELLLAVLFGAILALFVFGTRLHPKGAP